MKGKISEKRLLLYCDPDRSGDPRKQFKLEKTEVIVFAVRSDLGQGFDLNDYPPRPEKVLRLYTTDEADKINHEVLNQRVINERFPILPVAGRNRFYSKVKTEMDKLIPMNAETLEASRATLEITDRIYAMGINAVPSLVQMMVDRRPVKPEHVMFRNHPKAREEYATYGPAIATDVINTLLIMITNETFGRGLANSKERWGSDAQQKRTETVYEEKRASAIIAWRTYLYYTSSQAK